MMSVTLDLEVASLIAELSRYSGWEAAAARRLTGCRSPGELLARLRDPDADVRIVVARLLGRCGAALGEQRPQVIAELTRLLSDDAINSSGYGGFQCEDDAPPDRVADAANDALNRVDPNWKPPQPK
jgi:hypothetical protein